MIFNLYKPDNALVASKFEPIDYKTQNVAFVNECGSCHTFIPPNLLPKKKSWELIMGDLENHFGDDASLDEKKIKYFNFLLKIVQKLQLCKLAGIF